MQMSGSIVKLSPYAERKIQLNNFLLCHRWESNLGCLRSKWVCYPLLHCLSALDQLNYPQTSDENSFDLSLSIPHVQEIPTTLENISYVLIDPSPFQGVWSLGHWAWAECYSCDSPVFRSFLSLYYNLFSWKVIFHFKKFAFEDLEIFTEVILVA